MTDAPEWVTRDNKLRDYLNEITPNGNPRLANITGLIDERTARHVETQIELAFCAGWNRRADLPPSLADALKLPEVQAMVKALKSFTSSYRIGDDGIIRAYYMAEEILTRLKAMEAGDRE